MFSCPQYSNGFYVAGSGKERLAIAQCETIRGAGERFQEDDMYAAIKAASGKDARSSRVRVK